VLTVKSASNTEVDKLKKFLNGELPSHMLHKRLKISKVTVGHRFKRL
jgi:hypothetical protein